MIPGTIYSPGCAFFTERPHMRLHMNRKTAIADYQTTTTGLKEFKEWTGSKYSNFCFPNTKLLSQSRDSDLLQDGKKTRQPYPILRGRQARHRPIPFPEQRGRRAQPNTERRGRQVQPHPAQRGRQARQRSIGSIRQPNGLRSHPIWDTRLQFIRMRKDTEAVPASINHPRIPPTRSHILRWTPTLNGQGSNCPLILSASKTFSISL